MILPWMIYSVLVALFIGGAAVAAERCLRLFGRSARWVWVIALIGAVSFPVVGLLAPDVASVLPLRPQMEIGGTDLAASVWSLPRRAVAPNESSAEMLNRAISTLWIAASLVLALLYTWSAWRLLLEVKNCPQSEVGGIPFLLSRNLGPAVVGLLREAIVLPAWVLGEDEHVRVLVARHEQEHLRVGDQRLLFGALLVVVLLPWNAAIWWFFSRLRVAVEADCDSRLLRSGVDLRTYSNLLIDVGARSGVAPISALAFSRSRSSLLRRIQLMTSRPRRRYAQAGLAGAAAFNLALLACETPLPLQQDVDPDQAALAATGSEVLTPDSMTIVVRPNVVTAADTTIYVEPLIVIDGVLISPESGFDLESLETELIERVEVVKGAAAAALYGERAAGGVINIYMKTDTRRLDGDTTGG